MRSATPLEIVRRAPRHRRGRGVLLLVLLLAGSRLAAAEPRPPAEDVATEVLAASEDGDEARLERLAASDNPDPWRVADALLAGSHAEAAAAFAARALRPATEGLGAYVAAQRETVADARAALQQARLAWRAGDAEGVLSTLSARSIEPVDMPSLEAAFLEGRALQRLRRFPESSAAFLGMASRAESLGWRAGAAAAAEQAARSLFRQPDYEGAVAAAERWQRLEAALASERGVGRARALLALIRSRQGRYEDAEQLASLAVVAGKSAGDHELEASALQTLGFLRYVRGDLAGARNLYRDALVRLDAVEPGASAERFEPDADLLVLVRVALKLDTAAFAFRLQDREEAWRLLDEARAEAEAARNPMLTGQALLTTGALRQAAGDGLEALEAYEEAAARSRNMGDRAGEADVLRRLGTLQGELGDHPAALESARRALAALEEIGQQRGALLARLALGRAQERLGETQAAIATYERAVVDAAALEGTPLRAQALTALGDLHVNLGGFGEALKLYDEALAEHRRADRQEGIVGSLRDLGRVRGAIGETERALGLFEEALQVGKAVDDAALLASVKLEVGKLRLQQARPEEAVAALQAAYELQAKAGDRTGMAATLSARAAAERMEGHWEDALAIGTQLVQVLGTLDDPVGLAVARLNRALALAALGRLPEARADLEQGLVDAEGKGSVQALAQLQWGLAMLALTAGRDEDAMAAARAALDAVADVGMRLAEGQGAEARARFAPVSEIGAAAALRARDAGALCEFLERGRAGTLLASLGGRNALRAALIPEALRQEEAEARAAEAMANARLRAARAARKLSEIRRRQTEVEAATDRVSEVLAKIEREARLAAGLVYARVNDLEEVQAALLEHEALVLQGLLFGDAVALVVTRADARIAPLGPTAELEEACRAILLDEEPYVDADRVAALRRKLIEPLGLPDGITRLLLAPDGITGYVPHALLDPSREVVYVPSGSVLVRLRGTTFPSGELVLALGDPRYDADDRSGVAAHRAGSRAGRLLPLPATREEVGAIGDVVLLAEDATETRLRKALADGDRWHAVHLACHGLLDPERPTLSSLALTADEENDGFLTALDVLGLRMPTDLVVLSACETGKGKIVEGEGIVGLTRAFLLAGSPRVVVSLWKVDDAATQALMTHFYALWNPKDGSDPSTPAAALREAQAHVRSQPGWEHPFYWAAWCLWGLP